MNPETVQRLAKHPDFRELTDYLIIEAQKLNTLDGLSELKFTERAYEAAAKVRAYDKLKEILAPLINTSPQSTGRTDPQDYVV